RLERLQRVVTKLQMESGLCEEQLNQADALLQADVRLLAAGKAPQKAAEVERDLDKADAMIRLLFNDVQTLKDGRHPQGEQMYRRYGPVPVCPRSPPCPSGPTKPFLSPCPPWPLCPPCCSLHPQPPLCPPKPCKASCDPRTPHTPWVLGTPWFWGCSGAVPTVLQGVPPVLLSPPLLLSISWGCLCSVPRGRAGRGHSGKPPPVPPQNSSKSRLRHLESLHGFVSAATKELLWLSEREEEEVAFDWSHNNPAMAAKKESYS
ncbi:PLEC protein, partial [Calcarius ornatus]|nr:PLEC protein [Calcarius ornatus]